jgi:hypothetical protein
LTQNLLSLQGADRQLAETVQGRVVTQKVFKNTGEEKDASAHELFFVEFHFDTVAANKTDAVFRDDPGEVARTG